MVEQGLLDTILSQTGTGAVAALALWLLYKAYVDSGKRADADKADQQQRHEREIARLEQMNENEAHRTDLVIEVVRGNTASNVELIGTVNSLRVEMQSQRGGAQ